MPQEEKALEAVVLTRLLRLNATIHGVVFGLITGLVIFIATNWLVIKGGPVVGPNLALLGQFFIGYKVSFIGSMIGFGYGFLSGFLIGYFIASLYNWIIDLKEKLFSRSPQEDRG
jgi:tetrahydromethanopterin S-methyltransferase subunit G